VKWFKHQSDMIEDPRMRRMVKRFGADGYAVYNLVIERIVKKLDATSPQPDLEENSEDIADMLKLDTLRVQEIIWFGIEQGMLDQDEVSGRIVAHKVYKYLTEAQTKSGELRRMIQAYKEALPMAASGDNRLPVREEKRREEIRGGETLALGEYVSMSEGAYEKLTADYGSALIDDYVERIDLYCQSQGKRYKDYAATVRAWLKKDSVQKLAHDDACPVCGAATPAGANCLNCGMQRMYWADAEKIAERREIAQERGLI